MVVRTENTGQKYSIQVLLLAIFALSLLLALVAILLASGYLKKVATEDLAEDHAREMAQLAFRSIYLVMERGGTNEDIDHTITQLRALLDDQEIRVVSAETAGPGQQQSGQSLDPMLFEAFLNGKEKLSVAKDSIRYLYPIVITEDCLSCHSTALAGDISGVVEILRPIDNLKIPVGLTIKFMLVFSALLFLILLATIHTNLRHFVVKPMTGLVRAVQEVVRDTDLGRRIDSESKVKEVDELSESVNQLLSSIEGYNQQVNRLSHNDPLTMLYNRRKFEDCIRSEIQYTKSSNEKFSIIFLNIDRFHHINEANGHPFGDIVLKKITMVLVNYIRDIGIVARTGGDEFGIVLPRTRLDEASALADGLCKALSMTEIASTKGPLWLSGSFGVVSYPDHGRTAEELIIAGDVAVHKAKEAGRNRVAHVHPAEVQRVSESLGRKAWVRQAIREGRMVLFTQPIIEIPSNRVFGYEVLTRVREGDELRGADTFLEDLEQQGMEEFDKFVINGALKHKHTSADLKGTKLFINLSAGSIQNESFMLKLPSLLQRHNIASDELVIEITEREVLRHLAGMSSLMHKLKDMGIQFALDDFGSGFDSFLYLRHFPVDYVKIEGSFVKNMAKNHRDRQLVKHIHLVAKALGVRTIAEWVEDHEIHKLVSQLGIGIAQGYYYGKPVECLNQVEAKSNIA